MWFQAYCTLDTNGCGLVSTLPNKLTTSSIILITMAAPHSDPFCSDDESGSSTKKATTKKPTGVKTEKHARSGEPERATSAVATKRIKKEPVPPPVPQAAADDDDDDSDDSDDPSDDDVDGKHGDDDDTGDDDVQTQLTALLSDRREDIRVTCVVTKGGKGAIAAGVVNTLKFTVVASDGTSSTLATIRVKSDGDGDPFHEIRTTPVSKAAPPNEEFSFAVPGKPDTSTIGSIRHVAALLLSSCPSTTIERWTVKLTPYNETTTTFSLTSVVLYLETPSSRKPDETRSVVPGKLSSIDITSIVTSATSKSTSMLPNAIDVAVRVPVNGAPVTGFSTPIPRCKTGPPDNLLAVALADPVTPIRKLVSCHVVYKTEDGDSRYVAVPFPMTRDECVWIVQNNLVDPTKAEYRTMLYTTIGSYLHDAVGKEFRAIVKEHVRDVNNKSVPPTADMPGTPEPQTEAEADDDE
jgi:hypothetical protein